MKSAQQQSTQPMKSNHGTSVKYDKMSMGGSTNENSMIYQHRQFQPSNKSFRPQSANIYSQFKKTK